MQTSVMQTSRFVRLAGPTPSRPIQTLGRAALPLPSTSRRALHVVAFKNGDDDRTTKQGTKAGAETARDIPAFTRRREHIVGRIASLGMAADIIGEIITGKGPINQLSLETGFQPQILFAVLVALVGVNFFGGLSPYSETFTPRNQQDVDRRAPDGGFNLNPQKFLAEAEVNVGRAGMVGIFSAVILEFLGGGAAPLTRLGVLPPGGGTLASAGFGLTALVALFALNGFGVFSFLGDSTDEVY